MLVGPGPRRGRRCGSRSCACSLEEDPSERNVARYTRAEERYRDDGGYAAESEGGRSPPAWASAPTASTCPVSVLSGGERRRVELARILFAGSDVLLLDEPTNHLDVDAKAWLMGFLRGYRGALLVISHDLDLLDEAITRVLHLDRSARRRPVTSSSTRAPTRSTSRPGPRTRSAWPSWPPRRRPRSARLQTAGRPSSAPGDEGPAWPRASTSASSGMRGARGRRPDGADARYRVRFPDAARTAGRVVLEVDGLAKGYGGPPVFEDVGFDVGRGERLLVLGLNGAGKTSLLRILAGETDADAGDGDASATTCRSATTPRSTRASTAGRNAARPHARAGATSCPSPPCGACSACSG